MLTTRCHININADIICSMFQWFSTFAMFQATLTCLNVMMDPRRMKRTIYHRLSDSFVSVEAKYGRSTELGSRIETLTGHHGMWASEGLRTFPFSTGKVFGGLL